MSIHPLAIVSPQASIGRDVEIGPFCIVEADTVIGDGCILHSNVVVKSGTTLGRDNRVFEWAVLGGFPQHVHMPEQPGRVVVGHGNVLRENVTIHRALEEEATTVLGNHNLLMVNAHVAHDCHVGNNTILTNNCLLAGHVTVEDRAYISGAVAVHQFCRVGTLAMVGGQAHVIKDVPPYVTVDGLSSLIVGLNHVGLKRAGFQADDIRTLKEAYRVIYRSGLPWKDILLRLQKEFPQGPASRFFDFCRQTQRGIVLERRLPPGATIKLRRESEDDAVELRVKAG